MHRPLPACINFCDLPDELILEIFLHFESIRSYKPQSAAFDDVGNERARQSENQERQHTLYSVCLASRRLGRIATPVLYRSFIGTSTWNGIERLELFHRTLLNPDPVTRANLSYPKHLHYIENRLSDHQGNSLYEDLEECDTVKMTARYFYLLAQLVRISPNLQHLCVVSLETDDVSLWKYLVTSPPAISLQLAHVQAPIKIFGKLETLCLQINTSGFMNEPEAICFGRICTFMTSAPQLKNFWACGVMTDVYLLSALRPKIDRFRQLQRLEITKCTLEFREVIDLLYACEDLRHIAFEWAYLDSTDSMPSSLLPGLLQHAKTLQSLYLDLREVRFEVTMPPDPPLFGTLRPFINLRNLTVCERFTSDDHYIWGGQISVLLPEELENLGVLRHPDGLFEFGCHENRIRNLRHLAENCQISLQNLKHVTIYDVNEFSTSELKTLFNKAGVQLHICRER